MISDSTLCLVSGSKRQPERFDLADHFQAYRPTYCKHFHHEWGAELPFLLKRARIAVRNLKRQFPGCMLLVGVVGSGNELIGKKGIEAQTSWPFDHPDGDHYMELQEKVQEELVGFAADMFRYGVHSAALISAPDAETYNLTRNGPFSDWYNRLSQWFQDEVYGSQVGKCRFRLVNINVLNIRMDLRDQWHCEKSDENANHMFSFCQSVFHLLMRLYVLGDIALEVAASSPMNRPLGVLELRDDRLPPNQRYEELLRNLADVRHKRAIAAAELVARALIYQEGHCCGAAKPSCADYRGGHGRHRRRARR